MVQIQLTGESARLVLAQSQAAGFGDDVNEYVSQLILINQPVALGEVPSPRTHEELIQMLDEGIASGVSPLSGDEVMRSLRAEIRAAMAKAER
jgi:hypothetical protein